MNTYETEIEFLRALVISLQTQLESMRRTLEIVTIHNKAHEVCLGCKNKGESVAKVP